MEIIAEKEEEGKAKEKIAMVLTLLRSIIIQFTHNATSKKDAHHNKQDKNLVNEEN